MIKIKKIFIVLILLLLPNVVLADDVKHNHIFTVENFEINGTTLTLEGYSFISHQDNWGIINGVGNLNTYIVAYTGVWKNEYASYDTCMASSNCYSIKTTPTNRDMWYARCEGNGCDDSNIIKSAETYGNKNQFVNGYACTDYATNGSACLYKNIGFFANFDVNSIFKKFEYSGVDIGFKIVSTIRENPNGKVYCVNSNGLRYEGSSVTCNEGKRLVVSDLAVYSGICKVDGKKCSVNSNGTVSLKLKSAGIEFYLSEWSNKVWFDAEHALPLNSEGVNLKWDSSSPPTYGYYGWFYWDRYYDVLEYTGIPKNYGKWSDSLVQLDSVFLDNECTKGGFDEAKQVCQRHYIGPASDGLNLPKKDVDPYDYYTNANFVVFKGELKIKGWKINVDTIECKAAFSDLSKVSKNVNCGNSGDFNQCGSTTVGGNTSASAIYIPSNGNCSGIGTKVKIGDKWYIKVAVSADVLINQSAEFKFGNINPNRVYAGKGFSLGETTYSNTVTWINAKKMGDNPYYNYYYEVPVLSGNSCIIDSSFDINNAGSYYYMKDGKLVSSTLEDASFRVISEEVKKVIEKEQINNISFLSCDSNGNSNSNCANKDVLGSWSNTSTDVSYYKYKDGYEGERITNNYVYNLANSYVVVSGDNYGDVIYDNSVIINNKMVATGKKYYVDMKWVYDKDWPFNLNNDINPSFVRGMNWKLNGTCNVSVDDGYYEEKDPGKLAFIYKYRSISVNNPFPKSGINYSNVAFNWKNWYSDINNQNRLSNTYSNGIKYLISISKISNNSNGMVTISDINKYGGNYISMDGMSKNGSSDFVRNYFEHSQVAGVNYCGLGYFDVRCDK